MPTDDDTANQRLQQWLLDLAAGHAAALPRVIEATHRRLHHEAERLLLNHACAEEAVQDTWLRVWQHAAQFDPRCARPMTWLLAIVRHRAMDMLRHRRGELSRRLPLDDGALLEHPDPAAGPEQRRIQADRRDALDQAVQRLPAPQRQALSLVLLRGLSTDEVARVTRAPVGTAKSWLRRGSQRLQHAMRVAERVAERVDLPARALHA